MFGMIVPEVALLLSSSFCFGDRNWRSATRSLSKKGESRFSNRPRAPEKHEGIAGDSSIWTQACLPREVKAQMENPLLGYINKKQYVANELELAEYV
jgi:hypothetical protein